MRWFSASSSCKIVLIQCIKKQVTNLTWYSILLICYQIWGAEASSFFFTKFEVKVFLWQDRQGREAEGATDLPPTSAPAIIFKTTKHAFFQHKSALFKDESATLHDKNQLLLTSCALFNSWPFKINLRLTAPFCYSPFANIGFTINDLILKNISIS